MPNLKPLSNVSCVCFNERDKQFGQVVIARKKTIQVCEVAERLNVEHVRCLSLALPLLIPVCRR